MSAVITIMQPILRFLQLLCENHNRDLQVRDWAVGTWRPPGEARLWGPGDLQEEGGVLGRGCKYSQVGSQTVGALRPTGEGSGLGNLTLAGESPRLEDPKICE